jgi:hypothetical protein
MDLPALPTRLHHGQFRRAVLVHHGDVPVAARHEDVLRDGDDALAPGAARTEELD